MDLGGSWASCASIRPTKRLRPRSSPAIVLVTCMDFLLFAGIKISTLVIRYSLTFHSQSRMATTCRWLDQHEAEVSKALTDDELQWAGSYMRRSPHAMVNVLWSRQLEIAEKKRSSSRFYSSNIQRIVAIGRTQLEQASAEERS